MSCFTASCKDSVDLRRIFYISFSFWNLFFVHFLHISKFSKKCHIFKDTFFRDSTKSSLKANLAWEGLICLPILCISLQKNISFQFWNLKLTPKNFLANKTRRGIETWREIVEKEELNTFLENFLKTMWNPIKIFDVEFFAAENLQ